MVEDGTDELLGDEIESGCELRAEVTEFVQKTKDSTTIFLERSEAIELQIMRSLEGKINLIYFSGRAQPIN